MLNKPMIKPEDKKMTMREALEHCYKVFHSMADRGAYPQELLPYELGINRPSKVFLGVQGIGFIKDVLEEKENAKEPHLNEDQKYALKQLSESVEDLDYFRRGGW